MMASPEVTQKEQEKSGLGWNSHTYVDEVPANSNANPNPNSPNFNPTLTPTLSLTLTLTLTLT